MKFGLVMGLLVLLNYGGITPVNVNIQDTSMKQATIIEQKNMQTFDNRLIVEPLKVNNNVATSKVKNTTATKKTTVTKTASTPTANKTTVSASSTVASEKLNTTITATPVEAKKTTYMGIPKGSVVFKSVSLSQKLYQDDKKISAQKIVNNKNSAWIGKYYKNFLVADHVNQGFSKIKKLKVGAKGTINGTTVKVIEVIKNGLHTSKGHLAYSDGTYIEKKYNDGYYIMYTCNNASGTKVTIVVCQVVK